MYAIWYKGTTRSELQGVVVGLQEANEVVRKLNDNDPDRKPWQEENYWKQEVSVLTPENLLL